MILADTSAWNARRLDPETKVSAAEHGFVQDSFTEVGVGQLGTGENGAAEIGLLPGLLIGM